MSEAIASQLSGLEAEIRSRIEGCSSDQDLEAVRLELMGKKGKLTQILKGLGGVSPEERAELGKKANALKTDFESLFQQRQQSIKEEYYQKLAESEWYDTTQLPPGFGAGFVPGADSGHIHPISQIQQQLEDVFTSMGFSIMDGPQVETDYYNFGALNFTDDHPAREMQDTFYTKAGHLLRTHTSAVQVRSMKQLKPPMRIIVPGRVFRYEEVDASHEHTFYQMEGMIIEKHISISHLIFLMTTLLTEIFSTREKKITPKIRLRPGYFPFVEPGFELDMHCLICDGAGCAVCKKTGWVEVLPCGLVHPNVIKSGGLDPEKWQGAAFGLGLNRLVMMKYAIEDIRHFQSANPAFLYQF